MSATEIVTTTSGAAKTRYHVASVRLTARPAIRRVLRRNQFAKAA